MKINSFFCGAGGFDLGFIQAGFEVAGAWDFDKYAVESYRHNIGDHVKQMSVLDMKGSDVSKANGWLFGFPCQDISVAGKQAGMVKGQTRSGLFYEIMRLLGEVEDKPEWILAENVKAVNKFIPTIREEYEAAGYTIVNPQLYNTKFWFLPQNRERYFLMGIRSDLAKTFVFPTEQKDFIPKLSSILESNVDEKYYISDEKAAKIIEQAMAKITVQSQPELERVAGLFDKDGKRKQAGGVFNTEGLAPTLKTPSGGYSEPMIIENGLIQIGHTGTGGQRGRVFSEDSIAPCIAATDYKDPNKVLINYRVRKLTPREYARLQGFPDSYEQVVSNSQFYRQMGNAVSVTISHAIAKAIAEQFHSPISIKEGRKGQLEFDI